MHEDVRAEEHSLSEARRAALMDKLRALLEDFSKLAALEAPDREPAMSPWAGEENTHEPR